MLIHAIPCYLLRSKLLPLKTDRGNGVMENTDGISFKKKLVLGLVADGGRVTLP